MADPSYLIDNDGKVGAYSTEDAQGLLGLGYRPAGKSQIEDFQKEQAFHEKYGTAGQQLKTFGEGAAQSLTLGGSSWLERGLGVNPEDIKAREEENPNAHLAGSITGVALPMVATAGASALPEGIGAAAEASAPSLIAKAGEAASEGVSSLLGEGAESIAGRVAAKAASAGAGGALEGAAYGAGQVVHEAALGDPNLTASHAMEEIGLSALLGGGIGAGTGVLGQFVGEAAGSQLGKKLEDWSHNFEGRQNLKTAGAIQSDITREAKKIGLEGVNQLGREGADLGLVDTFSTPAKTLERSEALMESSGQKIGGILDAADASGAAPSPIEDVLGRVRSEVLDKMEGTPFQEAAAEKLGNVLGRYEEKFASAGETGMGFRDLHQIRKEISDELYGLRGNLDPGANYYKSALHDVRSIVSDEIEKGLGSAELPKETLDAWKQANREHQVAATFAKFAEKGVARGMGNNLIPLTSILSGIGGGVIGGAPGGLGLGVLGYLSKRYGAGVLASGARAMRQFIEEGAAEGLASKTAEAISAAREAGEAGGVSGLAGAWNRVSEVLGNPVGGPTKDLIRDVSKENLARQGEGGTPVETVAALSQLQKNNEQGEARIKKLAKALVAGETVKQGAIAGAASAEDYAETMDRVHQLANNPQLMQEHLGNLTGDIHPHAPETAQAMSATVSRAVAYLHNQFPAKQKPGPMAKTPPPSKDEIFRLNKAMEGIQRPTSLLERAAQKRLVPAHVQAVAAVHPQHLEAQRAAVIEHVANLKKPPPQDVRSMLSMLTGQNLDGSYSPQAIAANQLTFALPSAKSPDNQTGPQTMGKTTQTGLGKLSSSNRVELPGQTAERHAGRE